jgi:hypothetical protein
MTLENIATLSARIKVSRASPGDRTESSFTVPPTAEIHHRVPATIIYIYFFCKTGFSHWSGSHFYHLLENKTQQFKVDTGSLIGRQFLRGDEYSLGCLTFLAFEKRSSALCH